MNNLLIDDCFEVLPSVAHLKKRMAKGQPLRVKFGIDPSNPDLHLGHAVPLQLLRRFQNAGHHVILLIGDFTAAIGDPTGRNTQRPMLSAQQIQINLATYIEQAGKILNLNDPNLTIEYNSNWLHGLTFAEVIELCSSMTVQQLLERRDFRKRFEDHTPIGLHEFLYPLAQAFDSVALKCDIEIGGQDQLFNLMLGREFQVAHGIVPQICITTPLLVGTDGKRKMSKSFGNAIHLTDDPLTMFNKVMSIPDEVMDEYESLAALRKPTTIISGLERKQSIACAIVELYHDKKAANQAFEDSRRISDGLIPGEIREIIVTAMPKTIIHCLIVAGLVNSKREGKRMIDNNGVTVNGQVVLEDAELSSKSIVLSVGKKYVRLIEE